MKFNTLVKRLGVSSALLTGMLAPVGALAYDGLEIGTTESIVEVYQPAEEPAEEYVNPPWYHANQNYTHVNNVEWQNADGSSGSGSTYIKDDGEAYGIQNAKNSNGEEYQVAYQNGQQQNRVNGTTTCYAYGTANEVDCDFSY